MEVTIFSSLAVCIIRLYAGDHCVVLVSDSDKYTSLVSQRIELESMVSTTTHQTNCEPLNESLSYFISVSLSIT